MVAIAQLVEHLIVVQKVARSSRVGHPSKTLPFREGSFVFLRTPHVVHSGLSTSPNPRT